MNIKLVGENSNEIIECQNNEESFHMLQKKA